jgi:hypothetical protein
MAEINNHDIVSLYNRIQRFITETIKSTSSQTSEVNAFDFGRVNTYLDALDALHGHIINQPQLDLPKTSPKTYSLEPAVDYPAVENENVNDMMRMFLLARDELINSTSARLPAGLNSFDSDRLTAIIEKIRLFLSEYVDTSTPLDMPESAPKRPSSGSGRTGI